MAQLAKARDCNGNCNLEIGCSTHPQEILFFLKLYSKTFDEFGTYNNYAKII